MSSDLLTPAQVCRELRLTPKEIQQLVAAGWLEVAQRIPYKNGDMDVFWKTQVQDLAKDLPKIRRGWEAEQAIKLGPQKAAARREDQRQFTLAVKKRKIRFLHSLEEFSESTARILRVCFYLFHLNHYAKYGHAYLYDYKERVLQRLWQELGADPDHLPGIFKVTFILGTPRIRLCMDCRLKAQQQKKSHLEYLSSPGYRCNRCARDEHYYSLYEFTLNYGEYHFCFHLPYVLGRKWLTSVEISEKEAKIEHEGYFVFGRPIQESEALAVELFEVVAEIEEFLANTQEGRLAKN